MYSFCLISKEKVATMMVILIVPYNDLKLCVWINDFVNHVILHYMSMHMITQLSMQGMDDPCIPCTASCKIILQQMVYYKEMNV